MNAIVESRAVGTAQVDSFSLPVAGGGGSAALRGEATECVPHQCHGHQGGQRIGCGEGVPDAVEAEPMREQQHERQEEYHLTDQTHKAPCALTFRAPLFYEKEPLGCLRRRPRATGSSNDF